MNFDYLLKIVVVVVIANILPIIVLIPLFRFRLIPKALAILTIPAVVVVSTYIRRGLGFGVDVNRPANYIGGLLIILLIFLSEKYRWLDKKNDD